MARKVFSAHLVLFLTFIPKRHQNTRSLFCLPFVYSWAEQRCSRTIRKHENERGYGMKESDILNLPALVSAPQAAKVLNVSPHCVTNMCNRGELRAVRCGRVWRVNLADLLRRAGLNDEQAR